MQSISNIRRMPDALTQPGGISYLTADILITHTDGEASEKNAVKVTLAYTKRAMFLMIIAYVLFAFVTFFLSLKFSKSERDSYSSQPESESAEITVTIVIVWAPVLGTISALATMKKAKSEIKNTTEKPQNQ